MDLAVLLPLAALLAAQSLLALLLAATPKSVASAVAGAVARLRTNPAANAATLTTAVAVGVVGLSAGLQLAQGLNSAGSFGRLGDRAALALSVEELRALLAAALGGANVVMLLTVRSLADAIVARDKALLNLEVLRKQAAGVSAAYMSSRDGGGASGGAASRSASAGDKAAAASAASAAAAAAAAAKAAEARADALQSQAKGLEREYDRLLAENDGLKRRLAQADAAFAAREGLGGGGGGGGKKKEF
jgi:hypothetical protein